MKFNPRWIIGKTVATVDMRTFPGRDNAIAHDPIITFTDGSSIQFQTEEIGDEFCSPTGDMYGTSILYRKPLKGAH